MIMIKRILTLSVSTVFTISLLASAQDYSVTKLPTLGGKLTRGFAINASGQVVGSSDTSTYSHPFLWTRTRGIQDLGTLGNGTGSAASAINDGGQVVGYSDPCGCQFVAFWWSPATGIQNIGSPNDLASLASGINNSTEVVGTYLLFVYPNTFTKGFLWTQLGGRQDLGTLGCVGCSPNAINDSGKVVGSVSLPDGSNHAFTWTQADGLKDLGTLGGPNSGARAINSAGQVVGISDTASGVQHAFLWTEATGMQDVGTLASESYSSAASIDAAGRIVGSSWNPVKTTGKPFSWTQAKGMKELGPYGKRNISGADGVNTAGQILVSAYVGAGYSSYLVTPLMYTTLTSSPNPSRVGEPVTFTAHVGSAVQGPPPDGEIVTFRTSGTVLAAVPLQAGVATFTTSTLKGTRTIRAIYAGDLNYSSSKSAYLTQVVE